MATNEDAGLDLFITMAATWRERVPSALADESPSTVTRALELGLAAPGMSHSAMRQWLGLNQPEMSKIAEKLVEVGWIRVERWETDRRAKLITTTDTGRSLLSSLKADLNKSLSAVVPYQKPKSSRPRRRGGNDEQEEGMTPFNFDGAMPPDEETKV